MAQLANKLFADNAPQVRHPTAQLWLSKAQPDTAYVQVVRKREGLAFRPTKIYFYADRTADAYTDKDEWDDDLNRDLIDASIRASSLETESVRFSLALRARLRAPESTFGDDFLSAVLVEYLRGNSFADVNEIQKILRNVSTSQPNRDSTSYTRCVASVEEAIASCGHDLTSKLKYERSEAEQVLVGAIVEYLDERFSITNAKLLGFL